MANPHKGEVSFTADGRTHVLSFSANAMCEFEAEFGEDPGEAMKTIIGDEPCRDRMQRLRRVFWLALRDHAPDMTLDDAKTILRQVSPGDMARLVGEAFWRAMPKPPETAANPQVPGGPQDGTGPASSTSG